MSWRAPTSDGGSAIVRYEYRYLQSGSGFTSWATIPGGASATSYTVTDLENGTSYTFEVRAVNGVGGGQGATASATLAESVPGAPSGLTATGGDERVTLNWSAPGDGGSQILRYEYRYAASGETYSDWATVSGGGSARSLTISGLTNGTDYGFQVRAVNGIGEGEASPSHRDAGQGTERADRTGGERRKRNHHGDVGNAGRQWRFRDYRLPCALPDVRWERGAPRWRWRVVRVPPATP